MELVRRIEDALVGLISDGLLADEKAVIVSASHSLAGVVVGGADDGDPTTTGAASRRVVVEASPEFEDPHESGVWAVNCEVRIYDSKGHRWSIQEQVSSILTRRAILDMERHPLRIVPGSVVFGEAVTITESDGKRAFSIAFAINACVVASNMP